MEGLSTHERAVWMLHKWASYIFYAHFQFFSFCWFFSPWGISSSTGGGLQITNVASLLFSTFSCIFSRRRGLCPGLFLIGSLVLSSCDYQDTVVNWVWPRLWSHLTNYLPKKLSNWGLCQSHYDLWAITVQYAVKSQFLNSIRSELKLFY